MVAAKRHRHQPAVPGICARQAVTCVDPGSWHSAAPASSDRHRQRGCLGVFKHHRPFPLLAPGPTFENVVRRRARIEFEERVRRAGRVQQPIRASRRRRPSRFRASAPMEELTAALCEVTQAEREAVVAKWPQHIMADLVFCFAIALKHGPVAQGNRHGQCDPCQRGWLSGKTQSRRVPVVLRQDRPVPSSLLALNPISFPAHTR